MGCDNSDSCSEQASSKPLAPVIFEYLTGQNKGIIVGHLCCKPNRNALSFAMLKALNDGFDKIKANKNARVLILKSDIQRVFCAGADLKERRAMTNQQVGVFVDALRALMTKLANLAIPVIAAIDGVALGGGLEMALACDIRISTTNSLLGLVETRLGILPGAGGTQRLSRVVGLAKAKEMIFTGSKLSGDQAAKIGLVNHAVEDAYEKALELAKEILKSAPIAIRASKKAINRGFDVDINKGMLIEQHAYAHTIWTKDRQIRRNSGIYRKTRSRLRWRIIMSVCTNFKII
uniref:Uncharacterized protein n=1 Tax=Ditylenchus dipsaci TaxID=166011 RepID=A0A915EDU1_9BILA